MFIPLVSTPKPTTKLNRRKGGGGGGGGGGGFKGFKGSVGSGGSSRSASTYGSGGGHVTTLPFHPGPGPNFGGRQAGGGDRKDIYGSREYGSGYPGVSGRGVNGRGFPFFYWPVIWMTVLTTSSVTYLYTSEYGLPGTPSRPGGVLMSTALKSGATGTVYRVVADNDTTVALGQEITKNCHTLIADSNVVPVSNTSDPSQAQPEQALQYYRASSVVLTLDGYNNSATFGAEDAPDTQLPSGIDMVLLECLNDTIGEAVPLVDAGSGSAWPAVLTWILLAAAALFFLLVFVLLCVSGILCRLC